VTVHIPADPSSVSSFLIFAAHIQAYAQWRKRRAEFITEPKGKYEARCHIRDPDGYIIEIGQSGPNFAYG
jgi:hypothetical protein